MLRMHSCYRHIYYWVERVDEHRWIYYSLFQAYLINFTPVLVARLCFVNYHGNIFILQCHRCLNWQCLRRHHPVHQEGQKHKWVCVKFFFFSFLFFLFLQWYSHLDACLLSAGPAPPPTTISDHSSSPPPPSLEPAVHQEITSCPPPHHPQPRSGNIEARCIYVDCWGSCSVTQ